MLNNSQVKSFNRNTGSWNGHNQISEKAVEIEFYTRIMQFYENKYANIDLAKVYFDNPHNIDGLFTVARANATYRILIEAKSDLNFNVTKNLIGTLAQACYYLKLLHSSNELLPASVFLISNISIAVIPTEDLLTIITNSELTWRISASSAKNNDQPLIKSLSNIKNNNFVIQSIQAPNFSINTILETIDAIALKSPLKETKTRCYDLNNREEERTSAISTLAASVSDFSYDSITESWYFFNEENWRNIKPHALKTAISRILRTSSGLSEKLAHYTLEEIVTQLQPLLTNSFTNKYLNLENGLAIDSESGSVLPRKKETYSNNQVLGLDNYQEIADSRSILERQASLLVADIIFSDKDKNYLTLIGNSKGAQSLIALLEVYDFSVIPTNIRRANLLSKLPSARGVILQFTGNKKENFADLNELYLPSTSVLRHIISPSADTSTLSKNKVIYSELLDFISDYPPNEILYYLALTRAKRKEFESLGQHSLTQFNIEKSFNGDNIRLWLEECTTPEPNSFALNEDLRDSFNHWLYSHGYATVSHKVFLDRLENHELYLKWNLQIAKASKTGRLTQSTWENPTKEGDPNYSVRKAGLTASHIRHIAFK